MPIIIEMSLFLLAALAGYFGINAAVDAATVKAQAATTGIRSIEEVQQAARMGYLMFAAGVGALALARFISLKRGRGNVFAPFVLPTAMMAAGIGLALQMGYGNPLTHQFWPGPAFAQGILIAAALSAPSATVATMRYSCPSWAYSAVTSGRPLRSVTWTFRSDLIR